MHSSQQQINGPTNHDTLPIHADTLPALGGASYLRTGRILADRYRLERVLGYGAMGEVYRAMDLQQQDLCAVKLVLPGASLSLQAHQRLQQESKVIARLYHPNIVEVRDYGDEPDGTHFLVMELLEGTDLRTLLATEKCLPWPRARSIALSAGAALQYAHQMGVVHRDVNPNNIYLANTTSPDGTVREVVKVLDFGLAKFFDDAQSTGESLQLTKGMVIGTPAYVPPEAGGAYGGVMGPGRDQWSLAVVLYRMLAGRLPFERCNVFQLYQSICHEAPPPLSELAPGLPAHVYSAVHRALSKEPQARFPTIKHFLRALEGLPLPRASSLVSGITALKADPNAAQRAVAELSSAVPPAEQPDTQPLLKLNSDCMTELPSESDEDLPPLLDPIKTVRISAEELALLAGRSRSDAEAAPVVLQPETPTSPHLYTQTLMSQAVPPKEESAVSLATPLSMSQLSWLGTPDDDQPTLRDVGPPSYSAAEGSTLAPQRELHRLPRLPGVVESSPRRPSLGSPGPATVTPPPAAPKPVRDIGSRPTHLAIRDVPPATLPVTDAAVREPDAAAEAAKPSLEPAGSVSLLSRLLGQTTRLMAALQQLPTGQPVTKRSLVTALVACLALGMLATKLWFATHTPRSFERGAVETIYLSQYQPPARVIPAEKRAPRPSGNRSLGSPPAAPVAPTRPIVGQPVRHPAVSPPFRPAPAGYLLRPVR